MKKIYMDVVMSVVLLADDVDAAYISGFLTVDSEDLSAIVIDSELKSYEVNDKD